MPGSEHMGIDPIWRRVILPSTAALRLGILLALFFPGALHLRVDDGVFTVAAIAGAIYTVLYGAAWWGRASASVLGYGCIADSLLLGALLAGSGEQAPLTGFLCLLALALAHMCGGVRLAGFAVAAMALGWLALTLLGVDRLVTSEAWTGGDFALALDAETTYGGHAFEAVTEHQILRAALGSFFLIALSGCLAFARAQWERQRVVRACAEVEALEAIVDCYTANVPEPELWQTVRRSAMQISGARVFCAVAEDDEVVRVAAGGGGEEGDEVLHGLRVPLSAHENLIVRGVADGQEAATENLADLLRGSEETGRIAAAQRKAHYLVVPVARENGGAALVAVVHGNAAAAAEGLRLVAERAGLVLRARSSFRVRFELEPAPAGA